MVALLANPDSYVGERVWVSGVAYFHFEGSGIYLNRESYERNLAENLIGLDLDYKTLGVNLDELAPYTGRYVSANGEVAVVSDPAIGQPHILLTAVTRLESRE